MKSAKRSASQNPQKPAAPARRMGYVPFKGASVKTEAVLSGIPMKFEPDDEAVLKFLGKKDISPLLDEANPDKAAIYLSFSDGLAIRSISQGFKLGTVAWEPGAWYYIHCECEIETDLNPMKDYTVARLGMDGETIPFEDPRFPDIETLALADANVAELNYKSLNYPTPEPK